MALLGRGRATFGESVADEGGELAGEGQQLAEQAFGVELGELGEVVEHRLVAVDGEQEDEVGDLGDAAGAGLGQPRGEGFAALPEQAADLAQEAAEHRRGPAAEDGRDVGLVDEQVVVGAPFDDAQHADPHEGVGDLIGEGQDQARVGDFDGLGGAVAAGGVDEAFFDRGVAGQVGGRVAVGGGFGLWARRRGRAR